MAKAIDFADVIKVLDLEVRLSWVIWVSADTPCTDPSLLGIILYLRSAVAGS